MSMPTAPRQAAATPETGGSAARFSNAGVWQLGTGGWRSMPTSRREELPQRMLNAATKLRLPLADLPALAAKEEMDHTAEAVPAVTCKPVKEASPRPQQQAAPAPPPPRVAPVARTVPPAPPPEPRLPPITPRPATCSTCNCKNSRCLKQYCVCFARGGLCGPECACSNCANNNESGEEACPTLRSRTLPYALSRPSFFAKCRLPRGQVPCL